jgi:hypothetical protein
MSLGNVSGQITGTYKSVEYSLFERGMLYLKGIKTYEGGKTLTLKSDSTFRMMSCSVIETGKWTIVDDSLYLEINKRVLRNNGNNNIEKKAEWLKKPFRTKIYKIIENGFYREIYLKNKNIKSADKLIKTSSG